VWARLAILSESAKLRASQIQRLPPSVAATIVLHVQFTSKRLNKPCVQRSNTPPIGHLAPLEADFRGCERAQRSLRLGRASREFGLGMR
jgi:hypothetical protein